MIDSPSTKSSSSATGLFDTVPQSLAAPSNISEPVTEDDCVEIKEFLWRDGSDLTYLPSTMGIFAALYSIIIMYVQVHALFLYRSLSFIFLTANFRLGVFGNSIVIISVFRHKSLQSVRNLFIVALSTSDIVAIVFSGTITVCRLYLSLISFSSHGLLLANHGIFKGLALRHWSLQARSCNSGKMDHKMR